MNIRRATQSDRKFIAAIHSESWKDAYSDVLPPEFLAAKIDRAFTDHWSEIKILPEDVVLVAEEDESRFRECGSQSENRMG
jgi:hypothetical protein